MLPEILSAALAAAADKIGMLRATIALQAVLRRFGPLRIIDGQLRDEDYRLVAKAGDALPGLYDAHLRARFPDLFAEQPEKSTGELEESDPSSASTLTARKRRKRSSALEIEETDNG